LVNIFQRTTTGNKVVANGMLPAGAKQSGACHHFDRRAASNLVPVTILSAG
jgi:hypothetical protein